MSSHRGKWSFEALVYNGLLVLLLVGLQGGRTPPRPAPLPPLAGPLLVADAADVGDQETAARLLDCAIEVAPQSARVHNERALALMGQGQSGAAIQSLNTALKLNPEDADLRFNLGCALLASGQPDRAIRTLGAAIRARPSAAAYLNRGSAYCAAQQFQKAEQDYGRGLKLDPDDPLLLQARGALRCLQGKLARALEDYKELLRLFPENQAARKMVEEIEARLDQS